MLVLTRKTQESIVVDGTITITALKIVKGRVLLGITAPGQIPVRRRPASARKRRVSRGPVRERPL